MTNIYFQFLCLFFGSLCNFLHDTAFYGDDNALVSEFIMPSTVSASTPGIADRLHEGLDTQASTFISVATMMNAAVHVDNPIVRVTFKDTTGAVIATKEFMSE